MRSEPLHSFKEHSWQVSCADFSDCSTYFATGGWDKSVVVYNTTELRPLFRLPLAHSLPITGVRWLQKNLVTSSADRTAAFWDTSNGKQLTLFSGHTGWVMSCDVTDCLVTTASWDGTLGLWDTHRTAPISLMAGHVAGVWDCAGLETSSVIASASEDCTLRLWDRRTGRSFSTLAGGHDDSILSVCWSSSSEFTLASGSTDCSMVLWDTRTCKPLIQAEAHSDSVKQIRSLRHGPGVMASVGDHSLKVWDTSDASNMKLLGSRSFPTDLECVAVSPDRLTHVCGGVNSTAFLSLFVGVDEQAHADLSQMYTSTLDKQKEPSNQVVGYSRTYNPHMKPPDTPPEYIARAAQHVQEYAARDNQHVEECHSIISTSPVIGENCKRESSCSDSGVDVTSLSIC